MNLLPRVLVVDDDKILLEQFGLILENQCSVITAETIDKGLGLLREHHFDIVILDLNFDGDDRTGLDVFRTIHALNINVDILVISGETDHRKLIQVFNAGVTRFLSKPTENDEIRKAIGEILEKREAKQRALKHIGSISETPLIGNSTQMDQLREQIQNAISSEAKDILVLGETGTGKEVVSNYIARTAAAGVPFLAIQCGTIVDSLAEAELFGHVKGTFTGAHRDRAGAFEAARGGFIFLDEIGELPMVQQAKLLRVLQERKVRRVGANLEIPVNFRTIAATHRNLTEMIEQKAFREDLYYRLAKAVIEIPPLRKRKDDIPELAEFFLEKYSTGGKKEISPEALVLLQKYSWPGNIRQLEAVIANLKARSKNKVIRDSDVCQVLPEVALFSRAKKGGALKRYGSILAHERRKFEDAILRADGDRTLAAEYLGLSRATFFRRAKDLGLVQNRRKGQPSNEARIIS